MPSSQRRKRKTSYSRRATSWRMIKRLSIKKALRCFPNLANATGQVSANISRHTRGSTLTRITTSGRVTDVKCETSIEVSNGSAKCATCTSMKLRAVIRRTNRPTINKISRWALMEACPNSNRRSSRLGWLTSSSKSL